jgi:hypothetical protein
MKISTRERQPAHVAAMRDTTIMFTVLPSVQCGLGLTGSARVPLVTACMLVPSGLLLLGVAGAIAWRRCRPWLHATAVQFRGLRSASVGRPRVGAGQSDLAQPDQCPEAGEVFPDAVREVAGAL